MDLSSLYGMYGKLMVESEILGGRINEVKKQIADELNKPKPKVEKKEVKEEE